MGWVLCHDSIDDLRHSTDGRFSVVVEQGVVKLADAVTGANFPLLRFKGLPPEQLQKLDKLSGRERQVLSMIADGKDLRAIAEATRISVKTVETYAARIKQKFDLDRAHQLTVFAVQWKHDDAGREGIPRELLIAEKPDRRA